MVLSLLPCTALADEPLAALDLKYAVYSVGSDAWTPLSDGSNRYQYTAGTVAAGATGTWAWYYNSNGTYTLELNNFQTGETLLDYGVRLPAVTAEVRITGDVSIAAEDNAIDTTENYGCTQTIIGTDEDATLTVSIQADNCAGIYTDGSLVIKDLTVDVSASANANNTAIVAYGPITLNNCNITMKGASQGLAGMDGGVTIYNSQMEIRDTAVGIVSFGELSVQNSQIDMDLRVDKDNVLEIDGKEVAIGFICNGDAELTGAETQVRVDYTKPEDMSDCYHAVFVDEATLKATVEALIGPGAYIHGTKSITGGTYNWDVSDMVQSPPYGVVENESRPWGEAVDTWTVVRPYNITSAMSHATLNGPATIYSGQEYTATLEPDEGYQLPKKISVWVEAVATGSRLGTDEYAYDNTTGKITIFANADFENNLFITGAYNYNANTRTIGGNIWNPDITATVTFSGGDTMLLSGNSGWSSSIYYAGQTAILSHTNNETNLRFLGWYDTLESRQIRFENSIEENVSHAVPESDVRIDAVYLYATAKEVAGLFGTNPDSDGEMDPTFGPYTNDGVTVVFDWDTERWQVTLNNDIQDITLPARTDGELYLTINLNDHNITGSNGTAGNPNGKTALTLGNGYDLTITGPGEIVGGSGADSATGAGGNGGNGIDDGIDNGELTLRNGVIVRGGQGGNGAPGKNGGNGGIGVTLDDSELMAMDAYIYGGAGGKGGDAANGNAGSGGIGGAGAAGTVSACIMFVGGAISGGSGGAGGNATNGSGGSGGQGGDGLSGAFEDLNFIDGKLCDEATEAMGGDEFLYCTGPAAVTGGDGGKGGDAANGNAGSGGTGGVGISANFSGGLMNLGAITGGDGGQGGSAEIDTVCADPIGHGGSGGTAVSGTGHQYTLEEIFGGVQPPVEITTGTSVPGENGKNGTVRLTADIPGPVEIPDTWGEVTIDLNGHDIYGQPGTAGNPDGGDAIIMTHENDGTGTTLTIIDTSNGEKGVVRGGDGYPGSGGSGGNGITVNPEAENPEINIGAGVTVIGGNGANSTTGDGGNGGSGVDGDVNNNNGAITGGNGGDSDNGSGGDGGSGVDGNVNNNDGAITGGNGGDSDNGSGGSGGSGVDGDVSNNNGAITGGNGGDGKTEGGSGGNGVTGNVDNNGGTGTITGGKDGKITSSGTGSSVPSTPSQPAAAPDPTITVKGLNTVDHVAYIIGYEDGTVRPNGTITRAEIANIFFRLMTDEFRNANWSTDNRFSDVPDNAWYTMAVLTLDAAGIIIDSDDGSFRPNEPITRAELAVMAAQFCTITGRIPATSFKDVSAEHWAADEIALIEYAGWIEGYEGYFRPDDTLTRAEAVTIVNRMLGRSADQNFVNTSTDIKTFSDLSKSHWAYYAIMEATNTHDYKRNGTYETWDDLQ